LPYSAPSVTTTAQEKSYAQVHSQWNLGLCLVIRLRVLIRTAVKVHFKRQQGN
jgi:hypothetical protein